MPKAKPTTPAIKFYKAIPQANQWVVIDTRTNQTVLGSTQKLNEFVSKRLAYQLNNNMPVPLDNPKPT